MEKRFKNIKEFVHNVEDMLSYYINNLNLFPSNAKLLVQPEIGVSVIDDPAQSIGCDHYNLRDFLKRSINGGMIPNVLAIESMALRYYSK
ncbi:MULTISPECIES: hypothetical protein [Segatella]|jgi:hypothetical protein|uniref:Uncharacterized protein n=2 Tax=Segatella TaxID=2974251 RepID=D8DYZ9_9BACT|nr:MULTISPECIES: hypothetical protein [Segatella]MBQ3857849.1 hypothetical protein [Prevotella sp.]EFI71323.1 hypothetical protein PBR_1902 [Segatella baroniae B14]MDR4930875.1 hypothetical protein [Segatella bryantii]OYP53372.1 hypothetical protein CIK91_11905 [Segatella bryantii]UKK73627.1 hypothetical protein L6467_04170 [Segatella bryantii]